MFDGVGKETLDFLPAEKSQSPQSLLQLRPLFFGESVRETTMASNPLFGLLWTVLLFVLAWPIAFICAPIWLTLMVSCPARVPVAIGPTVATFPASRAHTSCLPSPLLRGRGSPSRRAATA